MKNPEMPHLKHDEHLCYLENMGYMKNYFNDFKDLVKNAEFICRKCGRSAVSRDSLCDPEKL
jgi:hypothetical protein